MKAFPSAFAGLWWALRWNSVAEAGGGADQRSADRGGGTGRLRGDDHRRPEHPLSAELTGRRLALVVLTTNHWETIRGYGTGILGAVEAATPGSYMTLDLPKPPRRRRPPPRG